ncbi:MAG: hypothetical protein ACYC1U_06820 [Candidatus Aquicultorales bacterium]
MSLVDRFTSLFTRRQAAAPGTTMTGRQPDWPVQMDLVEKFRIEMGRVASIKEANLLYKTLDPVKGVIRAIASNATMGGFKVVCEDERARPILEACATRTKMNEKAAGFLRKGTTEGDLFIQKVVDGTGKITDIKRMPALTLRRNSNDADEFDDPLKAFYQVDPLSGGYFALRPEEAYDVTWFAEWQIVHGRWDHTDGERYGESLIFASRSSAKKIQEGSLDMAIRRKTRAGMKYLHALEGANEADLEAYKERNKKALADKYAAIADFFSNKKTSIEAIQGDARLKEIDDVMFHVNLFFSGVPVPKAILGFEESINRDVLEEQTEQYLRELDTAEGWLTELYREILDFELLLNGILPETVDYALQWGDRRSKQKIEALTKIVDVVIKLRTTELLPDDMLLDVISEYLPDLDMDAAKEELEIRIAEKAERSAEMARVFAGVGGGGEGGTDGGSSGGEEDEED